ncbi:MAG TPA: cryptochrome/photolyase family protein [Flavisolibacter sp.]|nr:cryptochrome/photolyase family protein [Flavisolibacter sp.]
MTAISLVFPHQLFLQHPALRKDRPVYLIEEALFFDQYIFHKKKLVFHRASMKYYADHLKKQGYKVVYIEAASRANAISQIVADLPVSVKELHLAEVTDDWLQRRLTKAAGKKELRLVIHRTPAFLNTVEEASAFFDGRKSYFQTDFYIHQRKTRKILLDARGGPLGGKWSFDSENRLRFPKGQRAPLFDLPKAGKFSTEASVYIEKNYAGNYGDVLPPFGKREAFYPVTHAEADAWLTQFLQQRFKLFGAYEDAMVAGEGLLHHSLLSPLLNAGLLLPSEVLEKIIDAAIEYEVPLNSLEGLVRQVMGWREFIRIVYEREGARQRTRNYWGFNRRIPPSFWKGCTGLQPVDTVVSKLLENSYAHHIERLMVMGNIMLLCEFHPDDVYRWFMELFIDAYDWVMVPNTYGMTQFADGGLMMTKPYISGSNYLMKMGNWEKGDWQQTWDALFWRFMAVHKDFFMQNPRLGLLLKTWDKMAPAKQKEMLARAEGYLASLD